MTGDVTAQTFRIARDVHWLPLRGANAYFARSAGRWVLIDAGYARSRHTIAAAAARLCGPDLRPRDILLTHGHPDHAGAAVELGEEWGATVSIAAAELPYVSGKALYPEPLVAFLGKVLPRRAMAALERGSDLGPGIRPFDPAAGVPGLPDWRAVPTPGHTPGHTAFFRPTDRVLVSGDAVLTLAWWSRLGGGGAGWLWDLARCRPRLTGPPTVVTCDWRAAAGSIATLADLEPWVLATGHGIPLAGPSVAPRLRAFAGRVMSEMHF